MRKLDNQGVLVSKKGRQAVILTQTGVFRSVKLSRSANITVGEIVRPRHLTFPFFRLNYFIMPVLAAGISLLCFGALTQSSNQVQRPIAAYINLDANINLEAAIDSRLRIVSVRLLSKKASWPTYEPELFQNMPLSQFSRLMVDKWEEKGTIKRPTFCLMTAALSNDLTRSQKEQIHRRLNQEFADRILPSFKATGIQAQWLQASMSGWREAGSHHLSMGRYLLYLRANAYGKRMTLEEARQLPTARVARMSHSSTVPWHSVNLQSVLYHRIQLDENGQHEKRTMLFRDPLHSPVRDGTSFY
ncbi:MAG: hypothetical protein ACE3JK_05185 [Sporolactobacillus sp.]